MDMLYYIYIGSNRVTIDHLSKITGGMFMAVSSCNKAAKVIDGIRERYNTSILYEESTPQKDSQNITFLHKRFPRVYIILITEGLQKEHRKLYLQAGVNNTLSPMASEESLYLPEAVRRYIPDSINCCLKVPQKDRASLVIDGSKPA